MPQFPHIKPESFLVNLFCSIYSSVVKSLFVLGREVHLIVSALVIVEVERTVGRFLVVKVAVVVEFGVDRDEKSVVHKLFYIYLLLGVVKVE